MSLESAIRAELGAFDYNGGLFDVHAHTGADLDGTTRTSDEHLRDLDAFDGRSVIFPLCVSTGYEAENRRVIAECEAVPGRLVPFARLDPRVDKVGDMATAALAAGARGFKLHPRSEAFDLADPRVETIFAVAAEARVPVLIHAGLGVGSFGPVLLTLAERHRDCSIILAHAAISDLCWLWEEVPVHPNLYFDTSWWIPSDLIALVSLVPPGRILFGSDAPYMSLELVLAIFLRCARFVELSPHALGLIMGGQLERLLAGEEPADAGPAPGVPRAAPSPLASRAALGLTALASAKLSAGDPTLMLEVARLAIGNGSAFGGSGTLIAALLEEGAEVSQDAVPALAMAMAHLLTPGVESPAAVAA